VIDSVIDKGSRFAAPSAIRYHARRLGGSFRAPPAFPSAYDP
jgi:hypothetical protein